MEEINNKKGFSPFFEQNLNKKRCRGNCVSCEGRIRKIISFKRLKKKNTKKRKEKSSKNDEETLQKTNYKPSK